MGLLDFFRKGEAKPANNPQPNQASNVNTNNPFQQGTTQQTQTYTVKSGDSLSKIAKQYYGDAKEWRKIYEANKDQIKDPDLIHPGQTFNIPQK